MNSIIGPVDESLVSGEKGKVEGPEHAIVLSDTDFSSLLIKRL